jgi:hypothetical protein
VSDDDERWHWHDQRGVTWAAGAAAVALIVLLVVAVLRTAPEDPATSTTSATTKPVCHDDDAEWRRGLSAFSQGALPPGEHTVTGDSRDAT